MSRVKIMGDCRIRENIGEHSGTPRWSVLTMPGIERGKITHDLNVVYIYIYIYISFMRLLI